MRRGRRTAIGAALGLVVVAAAAPASVGSGNRTIHMTATTAPGYPVLVDVAGDVDTGPADQEVGDSIVLVNSLSGRGTDQHSRSAGQFTLLDAATGLRMASVALELPGGQVTLSGFVRLAEPTNTLAVTGGTGRFREAEGQMTFDRKEGVVNHYRLELRT